MINLGTLLRFDIREPDDKELKTFIRDWLDEHGKYRIAREAKKYITQLREYIDQLHTRLRHVDKLDKEEYKAFVYQLENLRDQREKERHYDTKHLEKTNKELINKMISKKKKIDDLVNVLIKSCEEGMDGTWDCSTNEGKEAFGDMITLLERIKE